MAEVERYRNDVIGVELRTVWRDGQALVSAEDLATALNYPATAGMLKILRPGQVVEVPRAELGMLPGRPIRYITEGGTYRAILRSNRPEAESFQVWVEDEVLPHLRRNGYAINPHATVEQLRAMPDRVRDEATALYEVRVRERLDYRNVIRAIKSAGGMDRDYADVQNMIYLGLFGKSAESVRRTQPQVSGERYQRDYTDRKSGEVRKAGDLRPSGSAKDYLTADQLEVLNAGVLHITTALQLSHGGRSVTLADIHAAALEAARLRSLSAR